MYHKCGISYQNAFQIFVYVTKSLYLCIGIRKLYNYKREILW